MKKVLVIFAAAAVAAGLLPVQSSSPAADATKLRGGLREMVALGYQPDQRLEYLVEGFRPGAFVVYIVTNGAPASRVHEIRAAGADIRWTFRSVDAVSAVVSKKTLMDLAAKPWVRALYPVLSGRIDDTETSVSGSITRGDAPKVHEIAVPAASRAVTVDLVVTPPGQPHLDANALDFVEAALVDPSGRTVMDRPNFLGQIAFKYGEPDALQTGTWKLVVYYRQANFPTVPVAYSYQGSATVSGTAVARDEAGVIPSEGCTLGADTDAWKKNPNLKKRGVTDLGAPVLWDRGIRGRGVRVAVLDTGTDASHVDLDDQDFEHWSEAGCAPKVIADALFTGGQKFNGQGIYDTGGHGTHVTGEISGTAEGGEAANRGKFPGVAPETSIIAGRIAIDVTALTDDMLAAGEWAVIDQQADALNLSFGIDVRYGVLTDRFDPQSLGFEALATNPAWGHPSIQVSAGNSGDRFFTIGAPAAAPHVNTIAASVKDWDLDLKAGETREDGTAATANNAKRGTKDKLGRVRPAIANFSSRGPTQDLLFAPDFAAPGRYIVATKSNQTDPDVQNGYANFSGTSMAAPHATGSAALLIDGYRKHFGTAGAFGNRPPFWIVAAAMSNTAFAPAPRPSFAGGKLGKVSYDTAGVYQMYGEIFSRENLGSEPRPVGPLVEGAGRVNVVSALSALTEGVLVYTAGNPAHPAEYELQPNLQLGTAKPTQRVLRTLRLDPQTDHSYAVSFRAASGVPSLHSRAIPTSWWSLPDATTVAGGTPVDAGIGLTVPANTAAGLYTGYVFADIRDLATGKTFTARLPALVSVEIVDLSAAEGTKTTVTGYARATDPSTFLTLVLIGAVNNDWPTYALEIPKNLQSARLELASPAGEEWDLLVYDRYGVAVADTFRSPPGAASLTLTGLSPGGYRVVVSRTIPSVETMAESLSGEDLAPPEDMRGLPYTLTVDLIGAASVLPARTEVKGRRQAVRPGGGSLPATGVPDSALFALGVVGLASAGGIALNLRRRGR